MQANRLPTLYSTHPNLSSQYGVWGREGSRSTGLELPQNSHHFSREALLGMLFQEGFAEAHHIAEPGGGSVCCLLFTCLGVMEPPKINPPSFTRPLHGGTWAREEAEGEQG